MLEISLTEKNAQSFEIEQNILNLVKTTDPETVEHLIVQVQRKYTLSTQEILYHIINLQNKEKLVLKNSATAILPSFKNYLLTKHCYWYWIVTVLSLLTTLLIFNILENTYPLLYVRYVLGIIFVLYLPGYTLIKALFTIKEIDSIERVTFSIGISLALVSIIGLFLNYTPWGIRLIPITISLLILTLTLATVALLQEYQIKTKIQ